MDEGAIKLFNESLNRFEHWFSTIQADNKKTEEKVNDLMMKINSLYENRLNTNTTISNLTAKVNEMEEKVDKMCLECYYKKGTKDKREDGFWSWVKRNAILVSIIGLVGLPKVFEWGKELFAWLEKISK